MKHTNTNTYTRCIKEEIHHVCVNQEQITTLYNRYQFLQEELNKLTQNTNLTTQITNTPLAKNQGKYRDYIQNITQPYKQWTYQGKRAKNFRFITEVLRRETLSIQERQEIAKTCQKHDWTITQDLIEDLHKHNHYPTGPALKNINRSKTIPEYPTHITLVMDWTTQDKENVNLVNDGTAYDLLVDQTHVLIRIPEKIRAYHVCKPSFVTDDDGVLYCMFPYEQEVKQVQHACGVGGYDWGKVLPVSCVAVYDDGMASPQYVATRETEHLRELIDDNTASLRVLNEKQDRIGELLAGRFGAGLYEKWLALEHEKHLIRNKRSRRREHYARLVARDIVRGFMLDAGVDELHFEGLSLFDMASWFHEFGLIVDAVREACEEFGFVCLPVSANNTSHRDPVSGEYVNPGADRRVCTSVGVLDRDYVASLNIACSVPVRRKGGASRHVVSCSGVGVDGTHKRRCRPDRRKSIHKKHVKRVRSLEDRVRLNRLRVERRERVRKERVAFYERVRAREEVLQESVLNIVSGRSVAVSGSVMAKTAFGWVLPLVSSDTRDETFFLPSFALNDKV